MGRYLFEEPWPGVVVLGCLALALGWTGLSRGRRSWRIAAGCAAAGAMGVYLLAAFITTDREEVERRTRELVAATAPLDPAALRLAMGDEVAVLLPDGSALRLSAPLSVELAAAVDRHAIHRQTLQALLVTPLDRDTYAATLSVRSALTGAPLDTVATQWRLTWRRTGTETWRIISVEWLKFQGHPPSADLWR